ncbi:MAG TPA: EthD family reductase [Sphingomicrobium sp.]|nr:EthD family reductase [Sphingomicrobium sp.]
MAKLVVIYGTPVDAQAFERYYFETHVPLAKQIPGLRRYEVSRGPVQAAAGGPAPHLIAALEFDDMAAIEAAFASEEGQRAAADVQSFATGGARMLMFETNEV